MTAVRIFRLALGALGLATLAYGVNGLLNEPAISDRAAVGQWLVGGVIGHDFLIAPVVFVLGAIAYRFTSARWRGRLAALLLIGGSLFLISIPALLRQGRNPNPTVLPFDYARNLGVLLAVLVALMVVYGGIDGARRQRAARRAAVTTEEPAEEDSEEPAEEIAEGPAEEISEDPGKEEPAADANPPSDETVVDQTSSDEPAGIDEPDELGELHEEEEQDGDPRSE